MWEHWQQVKWWHECRATSTITWLVWPQTWSMWTLTRTTTEDSWVPWACLFVVFLLVVSVVLVCCTVPCIHDWSHCGSSLCLVRLIVIAMSHAHVEWSDLSIYLTFLLFLPLASCTSFSLSPSSSLMSWTKTTRTAAEELGPPGIFWTPPQMKNHRMDFHGLERHWQVNKRHPDQTLCGQRFGKTCLTSRNAKKNKSGLSRNRSSTMLENCVVFTSLIQMKKNSRISWRMRVESWKFRCQQQCLARPKE